MNMLHDLRLAARSLRRSPGYVAAFVVTLGLGIGLNTAIFSVVNGVLLRPLPFQDAERIMYMEQPAVRAGVPNANFSFHEVADYRTQATSFDELVEFGDWTFSVVGLGDPHRAIAGLVTSNYFDVLGIRPLLGRTLQSQDDGTGTEPVMVLTHAYWVRAHGSDPAVVGSTVDLTGVTTRVVGVLEPGAHYTGTRRPDFYANYSTNSHYQGASMQDDRRHRMTDVFARLAPSSTLEGATAEVKGIASRLHAEYPEAYPEALGMDVELTPWQETLTAAARPTLLILMGTVVAVLILACANVANLTLARLIRKEQELATRSALGATASQIRRSVLAEHLLLAVAGSAVGLVLAVAGMDLLVSYAGRFTVRAGEVGMDWTTFGVTLATGVGIAVFLAWAPGMPVVPRLDSSFAAAGGARVAGTRLRRRIQRGLVVVQLGLSFALLTGAGLLIRTLVNLYAVDSGLDTDNVLTLDAPGFGSSMEAERELFEGVLERARHFPGVRSAAVASWPPLRTDDPIAWNFRVDGGEENGAQSPRASFNRVTPSYFETVGLQLLAGRTLSHMDMAAHDSVVVINESMARAYFRGEDPLGRRISWTFSGTSWSPWATVVGVVGDSRDFGLDQAGVHVVYQPAVQSFYGPTVLLKTGGDPLALTQHVVDVIHELDPTRPVDQVQTLADLRAEDVAPQRLNATLFGAFAALALAIAAVGVLGVLAFSVTQRTREFGVRMAVGANRSQVLGLVLREGVILVVVALVVGGAAGVGLSRLLSGLLFEIEPLDPATFLGAGAVLGAVALAAAVLPARRATRVEPSVALRSE
jgi:predicted permease